MANKPCRYCKIINDINYPYLKYDHKEMNCILKPSSIHDVKLTFDEVVEFTKWLSENYVPTIASKELKYWQKDNYQNNDYYYFSKEILTIWLELKNIYKTKA